MLQQRQQQRLPPIKKTHRFKLLKDVTQQPYQVGMLKYYVKDDSSELKTGDETDVDKAVFHDPGIEIVDKNRKDRQQRIADSTKEELDKVLRRVDNAMNNYEYAVQASLIQHGMTREDVKSTENAADIKELEHLLNDSLAKRRYKERLFVSIIEQGEQASEKARLLEQVDQFFAEQKQNFSGPEFHTYDDTGDINDDVEILLKSFDIKDCYQHVKFLRDRINELNEDIIQFLIQNTGTKQTKVMVERGKRKLAQVTKEAKEQLAELQSKLEQANSEMLGKNTTIQLLEKDADILRSEIKTTQDLLKKLQDDLKKREGEVKYFKRRNNDLEELFNRYKSQVGDLPGIMSYISQSETEDADDMSKTNLDTIDENENKAEKESLSSRTNKDPNQSTIDATSVSKPAVQAPAATIIKDVKKGKPRDKSKRQTTRIKKETKDEDKTEDPSEIYLRSQQLLESLLADKDDNAPDLNLLFKSTRGVDLNNVTIDNLPTAFANLRKFAISRVRELVKELETKEAANKDTLQILKQEFLEHKTTYEKERLVYFLSLNPEDSNLQEEQEALAEKADNAHKLQLRAQKTAEDALNHLGIFMAEQEKLDQEDMERQAQLVHRHSVVVNNMTGANASSPVRRERTEETFNDHRSPNSKRSTPSRNQWQRVASIGNLSPNPGDNPDPHSTYNRLSSSTRKASPVRQTTRIDSMEQYPPSTPLLRKTTQDLLRKKSSLEQPQHDRSSSSSRRISMAVNEDTSTLTKVATPQQLERTPSMHSRPITRSNSINPAHKENEKSSSGERSFYTSAAQSRRVSTGANRSPVRADELERVLTKLVDEEVEALENFRQTSMKSRTSLRERYISLLEEKKQELDDLKQQAEVVLSRPTTSTKERKPLDSMENTTITKKYHQQVQTSLVDSRPASVQKENTSPPQVIQNDQFKVPFFHLYESIYKFRQSIIRLLEQNKFISLADRLDMIKQISSIDDTPTDDFVDNSERVLKDTVKVLQNCMTTLKSTKESKEKIENQTLKEQPKPIVELSTISDRNQTSIIQEKELMIDDLNSRCQQLTLEMNVINQKHQEELMKNETVIVDQQKTIQNLQRELMRIQRRLTKIETEGIVQPSILFTHLDAERNEKALKQAVDRGKLSEITCSEINQSMQEYVRLPTQQFNNIVKRYIQHRKATELEDRIQSETFDSETRSVMERMGSFYEQRSAKIRERISSIRRHRTTLARTLTEKFDSLEHESSIFLIRPIYSKQGRAVVQSYMANEKRRHELSTKDNTKKKRHHQGRQSDSTTDQQTSNNSRQMITALSSTSTSDDEDRLFRIDKSFSQLRPTPASQQSLQNPTLTTENPAIDGKPKNTQLGEISRLQEFDIQRTLLPMAHPSVPLSGPNGNSDIDPNNSSLNLRSYVALSRPGVNANGHSGKITDGINAISRTELSALSGASHLTNPRTPFNSTVGDLRRGSPPLPPIKRTLSTSISPPIDEKQADEFIPSVSINEFAATDHIVKGEHNDEKH